MDSMFFFSSWNHFCFKDLNNLTSFFVWPNLQWSLTAKASTLSLSLQQRSSVGCLWLLDVMTSCRSHRVVSPTTDFTVCLVLTGSVGANPSCWIVGTNSNHPEWHQINWHQPASGDMMSLSQLPPSMIHWLVT